MAVLLDLKSFQIATQLALALTALLRDSKAEPPKNRRLRSAGDVLKGTYQKPFGRCPIKPVASSIAAPTRSSVSSCRGAARICSPIGKPRSLKPARNRQCRNSQHIDASHQSRRGQAHFLAADSNLYIRLPNLRRGDRRRRDEQAIDLSPYLGNSRMKMRRSRWASR